MEWNLTGNDVPNDSMPAPYLTGTPGIGGQLKSCPEDFFVEELPLYEACGEGEFLYLTIEKRGLSTPQLVDHLARVLSCRPDDIGTAGRKDAVAVTRQTVSVPAIRCPDASQVETDGVKLLAAARHKNKLKTGHLRGNRFRIVLRGLSDSAIGTAEQTAELIGRLGFVNWFGEQRFGRNDDTDETGFRLLRGEPCRRLSRNALRFALSAVQSRLFNAWARDRVHDGLTHYVMEGDVLQVVASGGCFVTTDAVTEQARFDQREIVLTGPMYGPKMRQPAGESAGREQAVLNRFSLPREAFSRYSKLTHGTRRPLLIWPEDLRLEPVEGGLAIHFALPSGAYATSLLREFQKTDSTTDGPDQADADDPDAGVTSDD